MITIFLIAACAGMALGAIGLVSLVVNFRRDIPEADKKAAMMSGYWLTVAGFALSIPAAFVGVVVL